MFFRSLKTKIITMTVAVLVLAIGFGTWININFQTSQLRKMSEDKVTLLANTIERSLNIAMLEGRSTDVQRIIEMVGTHNKIGGIRVLDSDSVVLRSSKPSEIGTKASLDLTPKDLEDASNIIVEDKDQRGVLILRNVRPILNRPECFHCHAPSQRLNGVLEVAVSLSETQEQVDLLRKTMVIWSVSITLCLALALTVLLSKLVTTPITDLSNSMARAEEGLDVRAKVTSEDEIGRLAHSFNSMIIKLNKAKKKVEKMHYEQMTKADRLATVGEMAAGIAHEIKNPLTGIAGVVQILGRDLEESDPRKKIITEVLEQIDRLDKAVKNLLSFARPPAPKLTKVNVNEILEKISAFLTPQFHKSSVRLVKDYSAEQHLVSGDPELLQQVFLNVMLNSVQAMPDGGEIRIKTRLENLPSYLLSMGAASREFGAASPENGGQEVMTVYISDSGKGMDPELLPKIFNPFFTTRQRGTGLGLSITHKIIEQHGGCINVESSPGKGTTFSISLPLARDEATVAAVDG